jgi:hypothetical protein
MIPEMVFFPSGKKQFRRCGVIAACMLFMCMSSVAAEPLEGRLDYIDLPLLLLRDPSLMTFQAGYPTGVMLTYAPAAAMMKISTGTVIPFKKNAASIIFENRNSHPENRIAAGFSNYYKPLVFGSAFSVSVDNGNPYFSIDVSAGYVFKNESRLTLRASNLLLSDSLKASLPLRFDMAISGPVSVYKRDVLSYDAAIFDIVNEKEPLMSSYGAEGWLRFQVLRRPMISFSIGTEGAGNSDGYLYHVAGANVGISLRFGPMSAGVAGGVEYEIIEKTQRIFAALLINPLKMIDVTAPEVSVKVLPDTVKGAGYYFRIHCNDKKDGSGIKEWTLCIATLPSTASEMVKSFSGGNLPPATIFWDTRDALGKVHDTSRYYVRFIAVDNNNNIGATSWIPLTSKKPNEGVHQ